MSWEERFFGTAPAALTAQVEGRHVQHRFPRIPQETHAGFDAEDMRVLDFRFLHGVAGPDGPGLLLSFQVRGAVPEGSVAVFEPFFEDALIPAKLPTFQGRQGSIVIANDIYGTDRSWTTKVFLPFAAVTEIRAEDMTCRFRLYHQDGSPLIEFTRLIPWPEPDFRDAMNAMSFTAHLLVGVMKASGSLTPVDIQAIRRDLQKRYALTDVGLSVLKRYLKVASKDPSSAHELGLLAREGKIFSPHDHNDILQHLIRFGKISSELSPNQRTYILEFSKHAGFQTRDPFETNDESDDPWNPWRKEKYADAGGSSTIRNAYRTLGLEPSATEQEAKKRYRHLVREVHPDRLQHANQDVQRLANERLSEINQAYELIRENLAHF